MAYIADMDEAKKYHAGHLVCKDCMEHIPASEAMKVISAYRELDPRIEAQKWQGIFDVKGSRGNLLYTVCLTDSMDKSALVKALLSQHVSKDKVHRSAGEAKATGKPGSEGGTGSKKRKRNS